MTCDRSQLWWWKAFVGIDGRWIYDGLEGMSFVCGGRLTALIDLATPDLICLCDYICNRCLSNQSLHRYVLLASLPTSLAVVYMHVSCSQLPSCHYYYSHHWLPATIILLGKYAFSIRTEHHWYISKTQYTHPTSTGHCIDVPLFFFANGIWAMLVDVCILVVPVPVSKYHQKFSKWFMIERSVKHGKVYRLNMPKKQKLVVASILLLGSL